MTDREDNLTKWQFPQDTPILNSGEFMLIWCDEDEDQGSLHTNFKLSSGGEFLALVAPDGNTIIDSLTFPEQSSDISYGRSDMYDNWDYMMPSPSQQNQLLGLDMKQNEISSYRLNSIYPNPFNSIINFEIMVENAGLNFEVQLISLLGGIVSEKKFIKMSTGLNKIRWNIGDLKVSSGVYFINVNDNNNQRVKRKILYLK